MSILAMLSFLPPFPLSKVLYCYDETDVEEMRSENPSPVICLNPVRSERRRPLSRVQKHKWNVVGELVS